MVRPPFLLLLLSPFQTLMRRWLDALHLNPLTQTYQLRPHLHYLDTILLEEKALKSRIAKETLKEQLDEEDSSADELASGPSGGGVKSVGKAVQVSVKPTADLSAGGAFGKSGASGGGGNGRAGMGLFDPLRAKEGEAWINLTHYHAEVTFPSPFPFPLARFRSPF